MSKKHFYLPDCQVKPGVDVEYLYKTGKYIVEKQPDVIICGGDFADMPSLSSWDKGKKSFEGRRYVKDIEAAHAAMRAFLSPIDEFNQKARAQGKKQYRPRKVLTLGNHEHRIHRAIEEDAKLDGVLSMKDLGYEDFGWEVYDFLERVTVDGIVYSHYFVTGVAGRPAGSARAQLNKVHMSCIAGHQQGLQIATDPRGDGAMITSVIAGSFYEHNEDYLGAQGNKHWRGCLMLHEVDNGHFDLMPISLNYINNRTYK